SVITELNLTIVFNIVAMKGGFIFVRQLIAVAYAVVSIYTCAVVCLCHSAVTLVGVGVSVKCCKVY
ncbi:hypothetical protein P3444_23465, partial [Vibrio parahaemolyticus]|nr:hypothetical protein [Vibrio parahaemolyticus]